MSMTRHLARLGRDRLPVLGALLLSILLAACKGGPGSGY